MQCNDCTSGAGTLERQRDGRTDRQTDGRRRYWRTVSACDDGRTVELKWNVTEPRNVIALQCLTRIRWCLLERRTPTDHTNWPHWPHTLTTQRDAAHCAWQHVVSLQSRSLTKCHTTSSSKLVCFPELFSAAPAKTFHR